MNSTGHRVAGAFRLYRIDAQRLCKGYATLDAPDINLLALKYKEVFRISFSLAMVWSFLKSFYSGCTQDENIYAVKIKT